MAQAQRERLDHLFSSTPGAWFSSGLLEPSQQIAAWYAWITVDVMALDAALRHFHGRGFSVVDVRKNHYDPERGRDVQVRPTEKK